MKMYKAALLSFALTAGAGTASAETCDLTSLPCWENGKCNIKFKNHTGKSIGMGPTGVLQSSFATTIRVSARKDNGDKTGNAFSIIAGASKTMNLEKKKNFSKVRVSAPGSSISGATLECPIIQSVLRGNGNCNIYYGERGSEQTLAYSCDNREENGY